MKLYGFNLTEREWINVVHNEGLILADESFIRVFGHLNSHSFYHKTRFFHNATEVSPLEFNCTKHVTCTMFDFCAPHSYPSHGPLPLLPAAVAGAAAALMCLPAVSSHLGLLLRPPITCLRLELRQSLSTPGQDHLLLLRL